MRSTPLAMLAGEGPAARGSAPYGLLAQGFDPAALRGVLAAPGRNQPASGGPNKGGPERGEHHLDMVGVFGSAPEVGLEPTATGTTPSCGAPPVIPAKAGIFFFLSIFFASVSHGVI